MIKLIKFLCFSWVNWLKSWVANYNKPCSANAIMTANVFKYFIKNFINFIKELFWSISDNSQKTPVQESLFIWTIFFHCFISSLPSYFFNTLFIIADQHFFFYFTSFRISLPIIRLDFLKIIFSGWGVNMNPLPHFIFQEELIKYQYNSIQFSNNLRKTG